MLATLRFFETSAGGVSNKFRIRNQDRFKPAFVRIGLRLANKIQNDLHGQYFASVWLHQLRPLGLQGMD